MGEIKKLSVSLFIFLLAFIPASPSVLFFNTFNYSQADEEDEYYEEIEGYEEWSENRTISKWININPGATLIIKNGVTLTFLRKSEGF